MELCLRVKPNVNLLVVDDCSFHNLSVQALHVGFHHLDLEDRHVSPPLRVEYLQVLGERVVLVLRINRLLVGDEPVVCREPALAVILCSQSLLPTDLTSASVDRTPPRMTPSFRSRQAELAPREVTAREVKLDQLVLQAHSSRLNHFDLEAQSGGLLRDDLLDLGGQLPFRCCREEANRIVRSVPCINVPLK